MAITLGKKITGFRKEKGMTQEELAEMLDISPQAISKWENDISCPDIMLLPQLAAIFGISVDELLSTAPKNQAVMQKEENKKKFDELLLKVIVDSNDGDKVRVNLPMPLVKMGLEMGMSMPQVSSNESLKGIDFEQILLMVEKGVIGKLVEIESSDGDMVEIVVE